MVLPAPTPPDDSEEINFSLLQEGDILYAYGAPFNQQTAIIVVSGYKVGVFHKLNIDAIPNRNGRILLGYIFFGIPKFGTLKGIVQKTYLFTDEEQSYKGDAIKLFRKTTPADVSEQDLIVSLRKSIEKEEAEIAARKAQKAAQAPVAPAPNAVPVPAPNAVGGGTKRKRRKKSKRRYKSKRKIIM
jgi:hypothetical protein